MTSDNNPKRPRGLDPSTSPTLQVEPLTPEEVARLQSAPAAQPASPQEKGTPRSPSGIRSIFEEEAGPSASHAQQVLPEVPAPAPAHLDWQVPVQEEPSVDDLTFATPFVRHTTHAARALRQRAGWARAWVEARTSRRARVAAAAGVAVLLGGALLWPRQAPPSAPSAPVRTPAAQAPAQEPKALALVREHMERGDVLSAFAVARSPAAQEEKAPELKLVLARAALEAREPEEALQALESVLTHGAPPAQQAELARAVVGTFAAGKATRTQALLTRLPRDVAVAALQEATTHWETPVRRGALQTLEKLGAKPRDVVAVLAVEAWQAERCAEQRTRVRKLLEHKETDARVGPLVDLIVGHRPDGCLKGLRVSAAEP